MSKSKLKRRSSIEDWLAKETPTQKSALENASRHFDDGDSLTVNTLEAIYGQESSFGKNRRTRGIAGAAGDFQLERTSAKRMGLTTGNTNDQRFDIDDASAAAAKYIKTLDDSFGKSTRLSKGLKTTAIQEPRERKKFAIASYNAGEGRIAKAQQKAKASGKDPCKWDDEKQYLKAAGATVEKTKEIQDYVEKVLKYEEEFAKKSKSDKSAKMGKAKQIKKLPEGGHWITLHGKHIFVEDK